MITNNFPSILNSTKSFQGFRVLQNSRKNSQPSFEIKPKLNPESHTIVHNIRKLPTYQEFKANLLSAEKLLAMSEIKVPIVRESRVFRREKLFKNEEEENRFIKSLQRVKPKNYTMPSLLWFCNILCIGQPSWAKTSNKYNQINDNEAGGDKKFKFRQ